MPFFGAFSQQKGMTSAAATCPSRVSKVVKTLFVVTSLVASSLLNQALRGRPRRLNPNWLKPATLMRIDDLFNQSNHP